MADYVHEKTKMFL